jgi:hypothetical protein
VGRVVLILGYRKTRSKVSERELSRVEIEAARKLAPRMDEISLQIFAASAVCGLMYDARPEYPTSSKGKHYDVTGFYQRKKGSR